MFTSSTTGPPKAVSHSEDSLGALNLQFAQRVDLRADTPVFMPSPLGHSVGAIHGARLSLYLGAALVLQSDWSAARALELVAEHRTEFTAAATPFLLDLARFPWTGPEPKMAPLRTFLCGGAQVPPALIRQCRSELPRTFVTPLWGMTEGGLATCLPTTPHERVENTVGVGLPDLELRVIREGRASAQGPGELAMRGPGVFNGYYRQDDLYRESVTADGFFLTGDSATIDADGYVAITGRIHIGAGVTNLVTRHPTVTANATAALDELSGGRAMLGLGAGWSAVLGAGGTPFKLDDLRRSIDEFRQMFTGEPVSR